MITAALFKTDFPEFEDLTDQVIERGLNFAALTIPAPETADEPKFKDRIKTELLTAHLLSLETMASDGAGLKTSASVGDVSVGMAQPPFGSSQWRFWLNQTKYGQQLLAMLSAEAAAGLYVGGEPFLPYLSEQHG